MTKCSGMICRMQVGYKVDECKHELCACSTEPITNADRIRSMTDEELANFVHEGCPHIEEECTMKGCVKCILEWLQKPQE